jgi:hypothetical protein
MTPHTAPKGSTFLIGRPAAPMPSERVSAIASLVQRVGGIREAHLPQCYNAESMPAPAQVLVIVFEPHTDAQAKLQELGAGLCGILPEGEHLDVLPIADSSALISTVRGAQMQIHHSTAEPAKKSFLQRLFGKSA